MIRVNAIPKPVLETLSALQEAGFEAHIVGGCVRDLILGRAPNDWDIATSALPEQIQTIFPESFYENTFGTVGVKVEPFEQKTLQKASAGDTEVKDIIEVTTYRIESDYQDGRHPKVVRFTSSLEEDLARRDFTVNAMAIAISKKQRTEIKEQKSHLPQPLLSQGGKEFSHLHSVEGRSGGVLSYTYSVDVIDPFGGQKDLETKIIRTVGNPDDRFGEDALRLMRAIRFWAQLRTPTKQAILPGDPRFLDIYEPDTDNWSVEQNTFASIRKNAILLKQVSFERIADELSKIILSNSPAEGVDMLRKARLLQYILPELEEGVGVGQNLHHIYHVYQHNILALKFCPSPKLDTRLASLLHDVGKPRTKRGNGYRSTFYNHDHVGARMSDIMLKRLRYPKKLIDKVALLVDNHLFYYNVGEVTEASVRRLIRRVGVENMPDLMDVRIADRLGSGTPKGKPYKLRHLEYMIDKVSKDAVSVKMLKINGQDIMQTLSVKPGPKIGAILDVLLAEVIEDAAKNTKEFLLDRALELDKEDLAKLRSLAKKEIDKKKESEDNAIKRKHWVK